MKNVIKTASIAFWLLPSVFVFSMNAEHKDDLQERLEQIAASTKDFLAEVQDGDRLYFLDNKVAVELDQVLARTGTKTVYSAKSREPGEWVVFLANQVNKFSYGAWYTLLKFEVEVSNKICASGANFGQEYRWVLITDSEGQHRGLTLAARSFLSLALDKDLIVYDHKEPRSGALNRFVRGQIFSEVEPTTLEDEKIWQNLVMDLQHLLKAGLPKAFTDSDSINLGVTYTIPECFHEKMRMPYSYIADDTFLGRYSNGITDEAIARIIAREGNSAIFARELGCEEHEIRDCFFRAHQFPFCVDKGNSISLFFFDPSRSYGFDVVDVGDKSECEQCVTKIITYVVDHAMQIFLTDEQYNAFPREKKLALEAKLIRQVLSAFHSVTVNS